MKKLVKNICAVIIGVFLMLMFGCREYRMYEYTGSTYRLSNGSLFVSLDGSFGENKEVNGNKIADYSYPYFLRLTVSIPYGEPFEGLIVRDVELVGEKTKRHCRLGEEKAAKINDPRLRTDPEAEARTALVSFGPLTDDDIEYENFTLNATILTVGGDDTVAEESISISIKTNFRKEKRNDWLEGELGR